MVLFPIVCRFARRTALLLHVNRCFPLLAFFALHSAWLNIAARATARSGRLTWNHSTVARQEPGSAKVDCANSCGASATSLPGFGLADDHLHGVVLAHLLHSHYGWPQIPQAETSIVMQHSQCITH